MSDPLLCSERKNVFFKEDTYTTLEGKPLSSHYSATAVLPPTIPLTILEVNPNSQLAGVAQKGKCEGYWKVLSKSKWSIPATNSNQKSAESFSHEDYLLGTDPKQNIL